MAKSVVEAVRHRQEQAGQQSAARPSAVGRSVVGFKKVYSDADARQIETARSEMRARLRAEG